MGNKTRYIVARRGTPMLHQKSLIYPLILALAAVATPTASAQDADPDRGVAEDSGIPAPEGADEAVESTGPATENDPNLEVAADPAPESGESEEAEPVDAGDPTQSGLLSDEQVLAENALGVEEGRPSTDPYEDPSQTYMFLGAFYRHNWTPGFMLGLFLDEHTATNNPAFGLEFTYRKDNFEIITSVYYQRYEVHGPFRGSGDADTETEIIDSDLFGIMASVDLMWGTQFNDYIGIQYGLGLGIGALLGDLRRTEAYPDGNGGWAACDGLGQPNATYCDDVDGDGDITGASGISQKWFNGGSVPNLYFRFAVPHLAIRIKPIHQLVFRIDGGFDLFSGFFTGAGVSYGF